jgi:predicted porin
MTFQKKMLAAAVGTIACTSAFAQSEVVVYGLGMPFLESVRTTGATGAAPANRPSMISAGAYTGLNDPARERISVGTSALGFRGSESLGGDLKLVWQLESGFQIDQNTGPGLGARNSKAGLAGKWGEVFFGQWDTPYKFVSLAMSPIRAGYVFDYTAMMGNPGLGVPATTTQFTRIGAKPDAAFDKRAGNSVQYWSPRFAGFSFRLGWSVPEGKTTATATAPEIAPQILSGTLMYDVGGLSVRYAYEQHDDYFGLSQLVNTAGTSAPGTNANGSSKDRAHKVVAIYKLGSARLVGSVEELDYRNDDSLAGAIRQYKRRAYYALADYTIGNNVLWLSYGQAQDGSCGRVGGAACVTSGMGARYYTAGYIYRFSKRTEVFAAYYRMDNRESGTYSPQPIVGASIAPGADTVGAGVGIIHYF